MLRDQEQIERGRQLGWAKHVGLQTLSRLAVSTRRMLADRLRGKAHYAPTVKSENRLVAISFRSMKGRRRGSVVDPFKCGAGKDFRCFGSVIRELFRLCSLPVGVGQ
jgi:hypothetical protein